jgi:NAD(P)H-flavin reductase
MSMLDELLSGADESAAPGSVADGDGARRPAAPVGPRVVVAHGVSYAPELAYRQRLESLAAGDPRLTYVPTVSRPDAPENFGWTGRLGRVESVLEEVCGELRLDPSDTVAYLCGNPEMVARSREVLSGLGFAADAVIHENYWTTVAA